MSPSSFLPDLDSPLNLPDILEFNRENNPTFAAYIYSDDLGNLTEISMLEFVHASYRAGNAVYRDSQPGDVVAIIANLDTVAYMALIAGLMTVGLVPFPISPRNSSPAILNLLRQSSAHRLLVTQGTLGSLLEGLRTEIQSGSPYTLNIEEAPTLRELYPYLGEEKEHVGCITPQHLFSPKDTDTALYLHSSGSTGLPKVIRISHLSLRDYVAISSIQDLHQLKVKRSCAPGLPAFHIMGLFSQLVVVLYGNITACVFAPVVTDPTLVPVTMTADNVLLLARYTKPDSLLSIPAILHIWSSSEEAVRQLCQYTAVYYGGGPLPPHTGDYLVSRGVKIVTAYGATELGIVVKLSVPAEDWLYVEFSERCNIRWVPQGEKSFEAQFLTTDMHHPAIENLSDVKGYASTDLFVPHPTIPRRWKFVGRLDDVIVHTSGEKTVPGPIEGIISSTPILQGVILFGQAQDQAGLLVEPSPGREIDVENHTDVVAFRNLIWPLVEEANKISPAFSRIFKEMILITAPNKPLPRVGKGSVASVGDLSFRRSDESPGHIIEHCRIL